MGTKKKCKRPAPFLNFPCFTNKGQALVEFTLVFILLLIVAWIPADFGLAMYTGQIAQNASREGARIAAAEPGLAVGTTFCDLPCSSATGVLKTTADRMGTVMMPDARITLTRDAVPSTCDGLVTVRVAGTYNFFFYRVLELFTPNSSLKSVNVVRETKMRWEHQC